MGACAQQAHGDERSQALRQQFLTFDLDGEQYGVNILSVQEIRGWSGAREVPDMPPCIVGVIDLRGIIVPIMDLRKRFALPAREYTDKTVVIIVATRHGDKVIPLGLVVDAVSDVVEVAPSAMKSPPGIGSDEKSRFTAGLLSENDHMVVVLDIEKLLAENAGLAAC